MHEFQLNFENENSEYTARLRDGTVRMENLGLLSEEAVDELIYQHSKLEDHFVDIEDGFWSGVDKVNKKAAIGKEIMIESMVEAQEFVAQNQSQFYAELNKVMHTMMYGLITDIQQI